MIYDPTNIVLTSVVIDSLHYQGPWDALSNTPTIPAASSSNTGHYYKVSVSGGTVVDGISSWTAGNYIVSDGSSWSKITYLATTSDADQIINGTLADARIASNLTGKSINGVTPESRTTGFALSGGTASKTLVVTNSLQLAGSDGAILDVGAGGSLGPAAFATIGYGAGHVMPGDTAIPDPSGVIIGSYTLVSGVLTFDCGTGNYFAVNLSQPVTSIATTNVPEGIYGITIKFTQSSSGGNTVSGWGAVSWLGGYQPTIRTVANAVDVIVGFRDEAGTWRLGRASSTDSTMAIASGTDVGGVKVGYGLTVGVDGTLSLNYTPSTATTAAQGIVQIDGSTIIISGGVISAANQFPTLVSGKFLTNNGSSKSWADPPVTSVAGRTGAITISHSDVTDWSASISSALSGYATQSWVGAQGFITSVPVSSVAGRTGAITLTHSDITDWDSATAGLGGGGSYNLPTATTTDLGGVKIDGTSITISSGVISAVNQFPSLTSGKFLTNNGSAMSWADPPVVSVAGRTGAVTITHSDITDWAAATSGFGSGGTGSSVTVTTMSDDVTLATDCTLVQAFDPNGANRKVTLPTPSSPKSILLVHSGSANYMDILSPTGDSLEQYVACRMHMNLAGGNPQLFRDFKGSFVIPTGNPVISTAKPKFNNASLDVSSTATTGSFLTIGNDLHTGSSAFCIEAYLMPSAGITGPRFWYANGINTTGGILLAASTNQILFRCKGTTDLSASVSLSTSAFSHVAYVYDGTNRKIFVNGSQVATDVLAFNQSDNNYPIIGAIVGSISYGYQFLGYMSNFVVTLGHQRYSGTFTPPSLVYGGWRLQPGQKIWVTWTGSTWIES